MPTQICQDCADEVRRSFVFKQMVVRSDETLRRYLQQQSAATKEPQLTEDIEDDRHDEGDFDDGFQNDDDVETDSKPKPEELRRSYQQRYGNEHSENDSSSEVAKNDDTLARKPKPHRYQCHLCDEHLNSKRGLRLHIRSHGQGQDEDESDHQPLAMLKVKREHDDTAFEALGSKVGDSVGNYAPMATSNASNENSAFYLMGEANGKKVATCKICDQRFKRVSALRTHLLGHATIEESFADVSLEKRASLCDNHAINPDEFILWIQLQLQVTLKCHIKNSMLNMYIFRWVTAIASMRSATPTAGKWSCPTPTRTTTTQPRKHTTATAAIRSLIGNTCLCAT